MSWLDLTVPAIEPGIKWLMEKVDCQKIHDYMSQRPRWKWSDCGVPSARQVAMLLTGMLLELLAEDLMQCGTGGLTIYSDGHCFRVTFGRSKSNLIVDVSIPRSDAEVYFGQAAKVSA